MGTILPAFLIGPVIRAPSSEGVGLTDPRGARVRRIVGGASAQLPPPDDPKVYLRFAEKAAIIKGVLDAPHYVFRGIRFAYKPTGRDRFQRPRQYFLEGDIDATVYPPPCLQSIPGDIKVIGSEDCLFLNVFTPDLPDGTEGLPVILWIHGGGFRYGSASQYGVRHLVGKRLVLVSIQYRLGTLGFLSTGSAELPGNAALWDMALAVQWVRNYIGFFGGNPHKIVVMGQGTGGSSALMVALSNIAKGSVSAIVAMSGTAVSHWALENSPGITAMEVAEYHGCPTGSILTMLKCLQNVAPDSVVQGDVQMEKTRLMSRGFVSGLNGLLGAAPTAEGRYDGRALPAVVETPPLEDMASNNELPNIPLLTGITKDETKKAVHGQYKNEIISKLKSIPNFLDKILVKNLQIFTGLGKKDDNSSKEAQSQGLFAILDPLHFRNYLQVKKNDISEGLNKIAEATGDALFNLPAFLTANSWSKRGVDAFLYRFDHLGKARKGRHFLKGLTLVGNETSDAENSVGHGDDLGYIFELRNLDGSSLDTPENLTEEDLRVRESYTQMIADFAKTGEIHVDKKKVEPFSGQQNNFIQISASPVVSKDFKFCEMGLWAGIADRLKSQSCQFLQVVDNSLKNVGNLFYDTVNASSNWRHTQIDSISKLNPIPKLGFGVGTNKRQDSQTNNMVPPMGFLG